MRDTWPRLAPQPACRRREEQCADARRGLTPRRAVPPAPSPVISDSPVGLPSGIIGAGPRLVQPARWRVAATGCKVESNRGPEACGKTPFSCSSTRPRGRIPGARASGVACRTSAARVELFACEYDPDLDAGRVARRGARGGLWRRHRRKLEELAAPLREHGLGVTIDVAWDYPFDAPSSRAPPRTTTGSWRRMRTITISCSARC